MSDHISTEEAERIAKRLERMSPWLGIEVARKQLYEARGALRSLAAERDELRGALETIADPPCPSFPHEIARAALGENQP